MTVEKQKCARAGCDNDGFLSFRGYPALRFCQGCYEYLAIKIGRIDREMQRVRAAQRSDNQPARIGPEQ